MQAKLQNEYVCRRLIRLYSFMEDTVLDPFLGSGTTCAVAKILGRKAIGVDVDPDYCRLAAERCARVERTNGSATLAPESNEPVT